MATHTPVKTEGGFPYPLYNPRARPEFRRPFSDGSMTIQTSDLQFAASLPDPSSFMNVMSYQPLPQQQPFFQQYDFMMPPTSMSVPIPSDPLPIAQTNASTDERSRSLSRGQTGKAKTPRSRSGRKGSMTDVKPTIEAKRVRTASNRAMSYSHPDGRLGLGLDTHIEHHRTNSFSSPDYTFGMSLPPSHSWNGSGSLQSMQSFGTTIDEAILDSPISPSFHLPPLPPDASEETRKQRRRECHNLVEKRRREHINTKIEELAGMLPMQYQQADEAAMEHDDDEDEPESPKSKRKVRRNSAAKPKELGTCKGRILTHSVQYIQDLRQVNNLQANRIQQLEALLAAGSLGPPRAFMQPSQLCYDPTGLEPLPASPEPEIFSQEWGYNPVFEESPDSLGTSSGGSASMAIDPSQNPNHTPLLSHTHMRQDAQTGMRMGMAGMELDTGYASDKRAEEMQMRW